jgi:hypothetical protein
MLIAGRGRRELVSHLADERLGTAAAERRT